VARRPPYPYALLTDPVELAKLGEWSEAVYRDFDAYSRGRLDEPTLRERYRLRVAILCLDMTGFTRAAIRQGELASLLRIRDVQQVCGPIFRERRARLVRAFADDLTALFDDPHDALDAALEVHRRIAAFNRSALASANPAECCIGIGYGDVYAIGPNRAMGDEMNRASKLGEDTARGGEILLTEQAHQALRARPDCDFQLRRNEALPFAHFAAVPREAGGTAPDAQSPK